MESERAPFEDTKGEVTFLEDETTLSEPEADQVDQTVVDETMYEQSVLPEAPKRRKKSKVAKAASWLTDMFTWATTHPPPDGVEEEEEEEEEEEDIDVDADSQALAKWKSRRLYEADSGMRSSAPSKDVTDTLASALKVDEARFAKFQEIMNTDDEVMSPFPNPSPAPANGHPLTTSEDLRLKKRHIKKELHIIHKALRLHRKQLAKGNLEMVKVEKYVREQESLVNGLECRKELLEKRVDEKREELERGAHDLEYLELMSDKAVKNMSLYSFLHIFSATFFGVFLLLGVIYDNQGVFSFLLPTAKAM